MYSLFAAMSSLFAAMSSLFSAMSSLFQTVSRSNLEPLNSGRGAAAAALAWVVRRGAGHVASAYVMVGAHSFPLAVPQRLPFERVPGDTYTLGQHLG
jgi:hypothetical protein